MERIEVFTLSRAWPRLSDEEFFWEPTAGAWGVRRQEKCRTPTPFGNGNWVADFDNDLAVEVNAPGEIEPMTTIGLAPVAHRGAARGVGSAGLFWGHARLG